MTRRIDAHHHVWRLDRGDYDWITVEDYPTLRRDFDWQELKPLLDQHDMHASVLVQAADSVAETHYMLKVAAQAPFIKAVVGWVDMVDPAAPDVLANLAADPLFRGIRPSLMNVEDASWILEDSQQRALAALTQLGLVFDALVWPSQLPSLLEAMRRNPELGVVINHFAYPDIASGDLDAWRRVMAEIASSTSAGVKFSGVLMGLGDERPDSDFQPACDHLMDCFGPERLLWGSDWPHLLADSDYASWYARSNRLLGGFGQTELDCIFGETAARFYGI
jgi:L-fuconolactonase